MSYDDPYSMIDLVKSARCIINVAGPYMLTQGELMIDCCISLGALSICWVNCKLFVLHEVRASQLRSTLLRHQWRNPLVPPHYASAQARSEERCLHHP